MHRGLRHKLDQLAAQHLADQAAWELVHEEDRVRHQFRWQAAAAIGDDGVGADAFFARNHKGDGLVVHSDDRCFSYLWNLEKYLFDITRKGWRLLAIGVPHLDFAREQMKITVAVHLGNVARQQPAFPIQHLGSGLRCRANSPP